MPASCANALRPTIALLACTGSSVSFDSSWLVSNSAGDWIAGVVRQAILPDAQRHHDLFERRVAGALADAVDRALDLPHAALDGREAVGDRQPEVVVAVRAEDRLVGVRHAREISAKNSRISSGVA